MIASGYVAPPYAMDCILHHMAWSKKKLMWIERCSRNQIQVKEEDACLQALGSSVYPPG
jgi:hypothetical protein